ncbi:uncharacterized protein [Dermacentor albipictus]|uniref:uncharacterized protein n=1 Tax=Dermacentor albipictus TaxID=60249 RepID=UPI0031FE388B
MATHEAICGFRQVRCLFPTCGYVNSINDLPSHLALRHAASVKEVHEDHAELVLQDPTNKQNSVRAVLLLHHESVLAVTHERTGQFYSEANLNVLTLTPGPEDYDFEIILRGPSGVNSWRSRALAWGTPEDTSVGLSESFISKLAPDGTLNIRINLMK